MSTEHRVKSADGTTIGYRTMGAGPGLLVVGGMLRTADDYLPLAEALAGSFTVHLVDRRGRGASGPLGDGYSLDSEVADLHALGSDTGARLAFGHSYGGLALLTAARDPALFDRIALYEPGVSAEKLSTAWMAPYRERLAANDPYGAFAHYIRGERGSPAMVAKMPHWYLKLTMRMAYRGPSWQRMCPLLGANLAENEQLAAHAGDLAPFAAVTAPTLILCGGRTAAPIRADFTALRDVLPQATLETLDGLNHFGPEGKTAGRVAERVTAFL